MNRISKRRITVNALSALAALTASTGAMAQEWTGYRPQMQYTGVKPYVAKTGTVDLQQDEEFSDIVDTKGTAQCSPTAITVALASGNGQPAISFKIDPAQLSYQLLKITEPNSRDSGKPVMRIRTDRVQVIAPADPRVSFAIKAAALLCAAP